MHTFISLEIESEQSGRRLGGWNGIIIRSLLCKESVFWCRTQPTMFWSQRHNALDQWTNAMVHPVPGRPLYLPRCTHRVSFEGKCSNIPMLCLIAIYPWDSTLTKTWVCVLHYGDMKWVNRDIPSKETPNHLLDTQPYQKSSGLVKLHKVLPQSFIQGV